MIKGIIDYFAGKTTMSKDCTCGQQANGKCIVTIHVSRTGVMSQKADEIIQCGAFKKQQEACTRIIEAQKKRNET